jgi:hypothetical protein
MGATQIETEKTVLTPGLALMRRVIEEMKNNSTSEIYWA